MRKISKEKITITICQHTHHSGAQCWVYSKSNLFKIPNRIAERIDDKIFMETVFRCPLGFRVFFKETAEEYGDSLCVV